MASFSSVPASSAIRSNRRITHHQWPQSRCCRNTRLLHRASLAIARSPDAATAEERSSGETRQSWRDPDRQRLKIFRIRRRLFVAPPGMQPTAVQESWFGFDSSGEQSAVKMDFVSLKRLERAITSFGPRTLTNRCDRDGAARDRARRLVQSVLAASESSHSIPGSLFRSWSGGGSRTGADPLVQRTTVTASTPHRTGGALSRDTWQVSASKVGRTRIETPLCVDVSRTLCVTSLPRQVTAQRPVPGTHSRLVYRLRHP